MGWLPFYVALVCCSTDVLLLFVVEYEPVILVGETLDILMHHEFRDVELRTSQSKEILQPQLNSMLLHPKHRIAMQKIHNTIQPLP